MYYPTKSKKKTNDTSIYSQSQINNNDNNNSNGILSGRSTKQEYSITPTFNLPFILSQTLVDDEHQRQQFQTELSGSLSSRDGTCFVLYSNELFIWTIDKPQNCDRIELPFGENITRQHIVVYKNKLASDKFSVFLISPTTGYIRFWGNSSKPNVSQDLPLESPPANNGSNGVFKVFITECQPFGVIVGNSNGSIFQVVVKNNNTLISKKINKSQGMLSYLYLSRQSPVISVFSTTPTTDENKSTITSGTSSSSSSSVQSRDVYVLTEGSLLKYEIINGSERVVLDYPVYKEAQKQFQDVTTTGQQPKFHQMYIDTIQDQNRDEIQIVNLIFYETSASQNTVRYYLIQLEIQDQEVNKCKRIDRFNCTRKISGGGLVSIEPMLFTNSLKYYLTWSDLIYYQSNSVSGTMSFQSGTVIAFSGFYKNQFYYYSDQGIIKLDIQPFGQSQSGSDLHIQDTINHIAKDEIMMDSSNSSNDSQTTTSNSSLTNPILFDIPKDENLIGSKRNNVLKLMNSYSLKQYSKVEQMVKVVKGYTDLDQVIQQVSLWIIDQQPNSKFWADDNKMLHVFGKEISIQLDRQLEDKKKRHLFFVQCLNDNDISRQISPSTIEYLKRNEIKIKATIDLRNLQNQKEKQQPPKSSKSTTTPSSSLSSSSSSSIFPQLIESIVQERNPNWMNIGMNVYELFYSCVSGIDQILINIVIKLQELQELQSQLSVISKAQILLESCELFYLITSAFPVEYLNLSIIPTTTSSSSSSSAPSIHNLLPKVIKSVYQFIQLEFQSSTSVANQLLFKKEIGVENIDESLFTNLYRLTEKYLYSLKINQNDQFNQRFCKTKLIEPFLLSNKFDNAITLANVFDDYFTYINVYISKYHGSGQSGTTDGQSLIIECLNKFQKLNQLGKVYEYMLEKELKGELLELPTEFNESVFKFLQSLSSPSSPSSTISDLFWLHSIRMKNWTNVSNILYQKSIMGNTTVRQTLKEKKKNLSLSKVSLLISSTSSSGSDQTLILQPSQQTLLDVINQNLNLIKSQKTYLPDRKEVLTAFEVIGSILKDIQEFELDIQYDKFNACIEIIYESSLLLKKDEVFELLKYILELSICNEQVWFGQTQPISDTQLSYGLRETLFFKLISQQHFPKSVATTILNPILEDYYKSTIKSYTFNTPDEKRQFEISVSTLSELSKQEINNKIY